MAVILSLQETFIRRIREKRAFFWARAGVTDWVQLSLHSIIEQVKLGSLKRGRVIKLVSFLEKYFSFSTAETEPNDIIRFEFETRSVNPHADVDYLVFPDEIIIMAQQGFVSRPMALRIVRIARLWYGLSLRSVNK